MALTPRQWWLYGYIKAYNERFPDKWLTQRDIVTANNVDVLYPHDDRYHISDNPNAHDKCISIWLDVAAINRSMEVDKIILINDQHLQDADIEERSREILPRWS
jgi:hypothetical protein